MRPDIDPDMFFSEAVQLPDELNHLGDAVTDERFTLQGINIDALPGDMYSTVKMQSTTDPDLGLEEIVGMMKIIFVNHSARSSVPKRSQESYRKIWNSAREPRIDNVRESAMTLTCHNSKKQGGIKRKITRS